jgi:hypothetical protein
VIKWSSLVVAIAGLSSAWPIAPLGAQTVVREREATITGPRGRSIDRKLEVERGPGGYERRLQIQRPGVTLERDLRIQPGPRGGGFAAGGWGPRPMVVERNIFVGPRPGPFWSFGFMAAPVLTFPFWSSPPPPPPVVVAAPPPVVAAPPGNGMVAAPGAAAQPSPLDPVALEAQRLQSHHSSSRRDAAVALGRLGDRRAVPPLVHVLKYDSSKDVKVASATALGQLGGPEAEVVLERCIIYEKKQEVRDAAAAALHRLREQKGVVPGSSQGSSPPVAQAGPGQGWTSSTVPRLSAPPPAAGTRSTPFRARPPAEEPALDGPEGNDSTSSGAERVPPPPPTPVEPR